jgi:hypothetical protein
MPKRISETTIAGVRYQLTQLGGDTVAELGERTIEATAMTAAGKSGLSALLRSTRQELAKATKVLVVDPEDPSPNPRWVAMSAIFDDHFAGARARDMGQWFSWAVQESGLSAFLAGLLKATVPSLMERLPSAFRQELDGLPTGSSSASA